MRRTLFTVALLALLPASAGAAITAHVDPGTYTYNRQDQGIIPLAKMLRDNGFNTTRLYAEDPGNSERMNVALQPAVATTDKARHSNCPNPLSSFPMRSAGRPLVR
jgi:hypothetical protein